MNVRSAEVPDAMAVLRDAASKVDGPIELTLGPPRTFMPDNPVVYLEVGGDPSALSDLAELRDAVFVAPLQRKLSWPWVPHVTVMDGGLPGNVQAAAQTFGSYITEVSFERVVLLELGVDRRWLPLADVMFARRAQVGTGGLAVELTHSRLADPELCAAAELSPAAELCAAAGVCETGAGEATIPAATRTDLLVPPVFLTARREGTLAGAASAWVDRSGPSVVVWVRSGLRGQGIGAILLAHLEARLRREGWKFPRLRGLGPAGFYERCGAWTVPDATDGGSLDAPGVG